MGAPRADPTGDRSKIGAGDAPLEYLYTLKIANRRGAFSSLHTLPAFP